MQVRSSLQQAVVISGPSGVGKGRVIERVCQIMPQVRVTISDTTRARRPDELDGVHYRFVSRIEFEQRAHEGRYLEYAEFAGYHYGTPRSSVEGIAADDLVPLLEIEVQGALQVMQAAPEVLSIFLLPPDMESLLSRLGARGTESPEELERRLAQMQYELACADSYHHRVVNRMVDETALQIANLIYSRLPARVLAKDLFAQGLSLADSPP